MGRKYTRWMAVAALSVCALGAAACGGSEPAAGGSSGGEGDGELVKVRGAHLPTASHLPIMVARDKGLFEKHGIDMELTQVQEVSNLPGTMGRQFECGSATMPDVIRANQRGIPVSLSIGLAQETAEQSVTGVMARKGSGIKSAQDLVGKTVGVGGFGGNFHPAVIYWLKQEGVDPAKVKFVSSPFPNQPDQLKSGTIDAAEGVQPFVGQMEEAGGTRVVNQLVYVTDPVSTVSWMCSTKWAKENPDALAGVTAAIDEAGEFIRTNEKEAREILAKNSKLPPEVAQTVGLAKYSTELSAEEMRRWAEVLKANDELEGEPADIDVESMLVTAKAP